MAQLLSQSQQHWRGTLLLVAQPAEESLNGADAMLKDGLLARFPRPDVAIAQHTAPLPTGTICYHPGYLGTASDNLRIRLFGRGAHGAMPQASIDPVVMAASLVTRLQTIVSREILPGEMAVVTVGFLQAGTRYNVIPDEEVLELTVRTLKPEVREHVLAAIARIAKAEVAASNAPREPEITSIGSTLALYNDPEPMGSILAAFKDYFGEQQVMEVPTGSASEDFSAFGTQGGAGIPSFYYAFGVTDPTLFSQQKGQVPVNHSPFFASVCEPSLKLGIQALTIAALSQLGQSETDV